MKVDVLEALARLIRQRNLVNEQIAAVIGRPALSGHIGEFIAAQIFDIQLESSASAKAYDGTFQSGPLAGQTVNIKLYGQQEGILDITPLALPDYYLVLTGPRSAVGSSKGNVRPLLIEAVYLFNALDLVGDLQNRRVKVGIATSVRQSRWEQTMVYPSDNCPFYRLSSTQIQLLSLFGLPEH